MRFFFSTWTLFDPETIQQANVACDHLFVIINESSAQFLPWYISCCIARSVSFNESGISGIDAESDWQQEASCHGVAGPEKHCVNWSFVAEQRLAPGCLVPCMFNWLLLEPGEKGVPRDVKHLYYS